MNPTPPRPARRGAWGSRTVRATAAAVGPGAARRGAWGARTMRATAAAVGPGAARRGASGARTVRATDAAVGPGAARRGAWGTRTDLGHRRRRLWARGGEMIPTINLANKQRKRK